MKAVTGIMMMKEKNGTNTICTLEGNELGQTLVDQGQDGDHHEGNEDLTAVVVELHGNARDMRDTQVLVQRGIVGAGRSDRLAEVNELRRHQRRHDRGTDPGVDVDFLAAL